ncbi:sulfotransferase [Leptothoe sp. LEGE 181152]|nr:sulfotransferase [Leptothoe sp. LEGE 181152]
MTKIGFGSFQIPKLERKIVYKSGVQKIVGWPIQEEGFARVIGIRTSENKCRKIVGVGLGKTGTTSLAYCLTYLGYRHQWYDPDVQLSFQKNRKAVLEILSNKDSCEDFPWPYLYQDIDEIYPDSKFILTLRKDPETWYASLCKHFDRGGTNQQKQIAYGYSTPRGFKKEHIDLYLKHAQAVQNHFSDRPDKLLVVCWENGDGWREICRFLGHSEPNISFPHANKAPNWQNT